ncbi:hypothetical protein YC2023_025013 [Brassica napus]
MAKIFVHEVTFCQNHAYNVVLFRDRSVDIKCIANGALKFPRDIKAILLGWRRSDMWSLRLATRIKLVTESENFLRKLAWNPALTICKPLAMLVWHHFRRLYYSAGDVRRVKLEVRTWQKKDPVVEAEQEKETGPSFIDGNLIHHGFFMHIRPPIH